ncbi:MAG: 50S ribosomal protein L10 [Acidimicrobiaceae bacterium]|nr:50S ribosomal protein L10 [Acidimicrobiaceae bacterium]
MGEARSEKVAVVDEVREKFSASDAAVLTEYRGLDVPAMAELRRALREAGGEYKVYKNTLVRFAVEELGLEIDDLLTGPTAIAFVGEQADGSAGDPVGVAKALKEFAKANEALIIKGGLLDEKRLTAEEISALAEIAPREVLLAQLAGAMAAPMQQFAALLKALPQNMAYALQALIEQGGAPGAPTADETDAAPAAEETDAADSSTEETAADEGTDTVGAPVSQDDNEEEE